MRRSRSSSARDGIADAVFGDDERRRRVTFVEGVLGEPFAAIVSKTAQSLVERFASELAGPRSDEARLGLQMVAFHAYAREAEDLSLIHI